MREKNGTVGYFCNLVPVEIIVAADMQPVRVAGKAETTSTADAYLCSNLCPYIKSALTAAIEGKDGDLEGVVFARSCDGMRRMHDVWKAYVPMHFIHMLEVPKNNDQPAVLYYASQLRQLAESLGKAFKREIGPGAVKAATVEANKSRRSMRKMYEGQQFEQLPMKGSDLFKLGLNQIYGDGSMCGEATIGSGNTGKVKAHIKEGRKPRVLISGNVMDRPDLLEMVENAGADVPIADLCTGFRHFARDVDEGNDDPYLALAQAYIGEPHCSRTAGPAQRISQIRKLIDTYRIDGVLLTSVKFCDFQLYDAPYLMKNLQEAGTPAMFLENDYTFSSAGQMKVRVEAFVEMLDTGGK